MIKKAAGFLISLHEAVSSRYLKAASEGFRRDLGIGKQNQWPSTQRRHTCSVVNDRPRWRTVTAYDSWDKGIFISYESYLFYWELVWSSFQLTGSLRRKYGDPMCLLPHIFPSLPHTSILPQSGTSTTSMQQYSFQCYAKSTLAIRVHSWFYMFQRIWNCMMVCIHGIENSVKESGKSSSSLDPTLPWTNPWIVYLVIAAVALQFSDSHDWDSKHTAL